MDPQKPLSLRESIPGASGFKIIDLLSTVFLCAVFCSILAPVARLELATWSPWMTIGQLIGFGFFGAILGMSLGYFHPRRAWSMLISSTIGGCLAPILLISCLTDEKYIQRTCIASMVLSLLAFAIFCWTSRDRVPRERADVP
jgi:hypothetical protein